MDDILQNPDQWPETVTLRKTVSFPAIINGKQVGMVGAPEGTVVEMIGVKRGKIIIRHRSGAELAVDPSDVDL